MTDDPTAGTFAVWFRRELAVREWTAAEFARRSRLSPSTVGKWLRGERLYPTGASAQAIADALGVPIDEVLARAGVARIEGDSDADTLRRRINALVELLPDDRLEIVVDILEGLRAGERRRAREGSER